MYTDIEIRFIRTLAEWYGNPRDGTCTPNAVSISLGVSLDDSYRLIDMARERGFVKNVLVADGRVAAFASTRTAVDAIARIDADLEASKRPDRVEAANNWIRRHRLTAWILIGIVAVAAASQLANNVLDICVKLGWILRR